MARHFQLWKAAAFLYSEGIKTLHHEQGRLALKGSYTMRAQPAAFHFPGGSQIYSGSDPNPFAYIRIPDSSLTGLRKTDKPFFPVWWTIDALIDDRFNEVYRDPAEHFSQLRVSFLARFQRAWQSLVSLWSYRFDNEIIMPVSNSAGA